MTGDAFQRARPGERMTLSAAAWNACLDAAEAHRTRKPTGTPRTPQFRQADIVLVKNASETAVPRFGVLGVDGVIVTPDDSLANFQNQVALVGGTPDTLTHRGKFVVCLDPLAAGAIGRAWIAGVCAAKVEVTHDDDRFAEVLDGENAKLGSIASGTARILFRESAGAGTKWCVIRLGESGDDLRIGKTEYAWDKGTTASIPLFEEGEPPDLTATGENLEGCVNLFANVAADKWVAMLTGPRGKPFLIAAEC